LLHFKVALFLHTDFRLCQAVLEPSWDGMAPSCSVSA
jgi:hypothetical protein